MESPNAVLPGVQTVMRAALTHDARLQFRAALNMSRIVDFANEMQDGTQFEPVVAFYDGVVTWLSDGYHRDAAAESLDWQTIEADIRKGTFLDALFYAYRANASPSHQQLTARERREGIWRMIAEAPALSDYALAEKAGVNHATVSRARAAMPAPIAAAIGDPVQRVGRDGKTYSDVSRIGHRPRADDDAGVPDDTDDAGDAPDTYGQFDWPEEETESAEEKAFYALSRQRLICRYTPEQIAAAVPNPADDLPGFQEFADWVTRFVAELQTRTHIRIA